MPILKLILTGLATVLATLLIMHCSSNLTGASDDSSDEADADDNTTRELTDVSTWTYQLQNIDPDEIGESLFDLAVVDYSADGSDSEAFSSEDVATMKGTGETKKFVIAYMSIGEAEDYRFYYEAGADYLDEENPEWPGNYKAHYWESEWQDIIDEYIDRLIDADFDGVYLDIIDAYEYFGPGGDSGMERETAADDMSGFVQHIAEYAREQSSEFLVFPQNGSALINEVGDQAAYFAAIDGIGAEDSFYFGDEDVDNDLDVQSDVIANLDAFIAAGKIVLSVDYLTDQDKIDDYYQRADQKGYIPYATIRDLDAATVNEGHEPE